MADDEKVKVDAIVVGGGPAGLSAAFTMARAGLEVILIERGEYAGAKNVGGLVYGAVLNRLIPNFWEQAPIERCVARRSLVFLNDDMHVGLDFGADEWTRPPFNNTFVVHRSQFDRWFSKQVEAAGANLIEGMVVEDLIYEETAGRKKAVGVKLRGDEAFYADVVVLADGANGLVTEKVAQTLGLKGGKTAQDYAVGVKEIIALPKATIEDRFQLDDGQGVALDFFGSPFKGLTGGGFLYTAKDSLHLGFAAKMETLAHAGVSPNEVLDGLKRHPVVRKYIRGGELQEYSAHLIPEGGFHAVPELTGDGVLIVGDAGGFVNMSLYKEGTNHAMDTGRLAGETVVAAKKAGRFDRAGLAGYEAAVRQSVAWKDLKRYRKVPEILEKSPNLLSLYPAKANRMIVDFFTVNGLPKGVAQRKAICSFLRGLPKWAFVRDVIRARGLM